MHDKLQRGPTFFLFFWDSSTSLAKYSLVISAPARGAMKSAIMNDFCLRSNMQHLRVFGKLLITAVPAKDDVHKASDPGRSADSTSTPLMIIKQVN